MQFEIQRNVLASFRERLQQPRRFLQAVAGPRRVGNTTLVRQALSARARQTGNTLAQHSVSAGNPGLVGSSWLSSQWETAQARLPPKPAEEVNRFWDEDTRFWRDGQT